MKPISGKEMAKVLEGKGWTLLRIQGSHHIYGKEGYKVRLSIPVHGNKPLKMGLAKFLIKTAGLNEGDFK